MDCSWCGGEIFTPFPNVMGEVFCSRYHRQASNKARNDFLNKPGTRSPEELYIEHGHDAAGDQWGDRGEE